MAEKKQQSKLQLFFLLVIPLLFAITIGLLISTFAGFNIFDAAKQAIPGLSSEKTGEQAVGEETQDRLDMQATIANQKQKIRKLEDELEQKELQAEKLSSAIDQLEAKLEQKKTGASESAVSEKELAKMYEEMSAKNAAAILAELDNRTAVDLLERIKTDKRAAIMEKLPSKRAAEFTQLLYQP